MPSNHLRTQASDLPYDDIHHIGQRIGDDQGGVYGQDRLQGLGGPHELPWGKIFNVLEGLELRVDLHGVSVTTVRPGPFSQGAQEAWNSELTCKMCQ